MKLIIVMPGTVHSVRISYLFCGYNNVIFQYILYGVYFNAILLHLQSVTLTITLYSVSIMFYYIFCTFCLHWFTKWLILHGKDTHILDTWPSPLKLGLCQINVRETPRSNRKRTFQSNHFRAIGHKKHRMKTNKTQDEDKQNTKHRMKTNKTQDEDKQNTKHRMKTNKTQNTGWRQTKQKTQD